MLCNSQAMLGHLNDAHLHPTINTISFERSPRSERVLGPRARARAPQKLQFGALWGAARTQDPIHFEDLFQGKNC